MKNYIKKIQVIIVLTIMFSFNVNAQMYHNGIFYIINESECTAEVAFGLDSYGGYSGDIVIPENIERSFDNKIFTVKSIGVGAFSECFNLTSIEIPNTVTEICGRAFNECLRLTKFKIPSSVMTIANYAFYDCVSLAEIVCLAVVPPRIQSSNVFEGVDKSIPLYVRKGSKISYETADYWNEFTNIIEVETDGGEITPDINTCFEYNGLMYRITKKGEEVEVTYCDPDTGKKYSGDITIPKTIAYNGVTYNVTGIGWYAFANCTDLNSITIGKSVETIADEAFYGCSGLTTVNLPESVISIGGHAFYGCSGLTSIVIPNSVTSIGEEAFAYCESLAKIVIGESVISIGKGAFACYNLIKVIWNAINCSDLDKGDKSIFGPYTDVIFNIKSFEFGDLVQHIPANLCYNMNSLRNIEIPNSVTSIGDYAFWGCAYLTSVVIPDNVVSIGEGAFYSCLAMQSLTIGKSVETIQDMAFYCIDNLSEINCLANIPPSIEENTFDDYSYNAKLYIPKESYKDYFNHPIWSKFNIVVEIEKFELDPCEAVTHIGDEIQITPIIIPEIVTDLSVTWTSSNESVATVDTNGLVTAIAVGEAIITATTIDSSNLSATCKVTVMPTLAESITLDKTEISLEATQTATLVATILPELATNKAATWTSSDKAVATVDENGLVTAIAVGETTITATTVDGSNLSASCKVTVIPTLVTSIEVTPTEYEGVEGSEFQLTAIILPENATNKNVNWSSSDEAIANVSEDGLVKVLKEGNAVITASTTDGSNLTATCKITVLTSIDGVSDDNIIVVTSGDYIIVSNAPKNVDVNVYSNNGTLIRSVKSAGETISINISSIGIYYVKVGNKTVKVII